MPSVRWTQQAERQSFKIPSQARQELFQILQHLRDFPYLGQMVTEGRYRGNRSIRFGRYWRLYYRVEGDEPTCVMREIRDSRRRPV